MNHAAIQWTIDILNKKDYQLQSHLPDLIQNNPWAIVYRFTTDQGFIFLKCIPPVFSLEPKIIMLLRSEFQANVPFVIAENNELGCFLMKDAGIQLHHFFKPYFQPDVLIQVMRAYTELQISATNKIQRFLDMGVPDWRLENLPLLYQDLLAQETLLLDDGLNKNDLIKLKDLAPKLNFFCEKLANYKIRDTFGHADFHDKNICVNPDTHQTTIIDLGEVVITYPFFSFLNCLYRAKENFTLTEKQYIQLQLDCFEPWLELESQNNLLEILSIINQCWPIHSVLGEYRLIKSIDKADVPPLLRKGRFAGNLMYWLNQ